VKERTVKEHRPRTPVPSLYWRKVVSVIRPLFRPSTPLREPPVPPAVPRVYAARCDRAARIPVSERGLVPRENTAFLGAARDSGIAPVEVV